jgi:hypothetical protein
MVMMLAITSLVIGGAIGVMVYSSDQRVLQDAGGEIELLAKRARTASVLHQTPYAIEFWPGRVRLMPFAEAGEDEQTTALGRSIGGERVEDANGRTPVRGEYVLEEDIAMFIRRWNSNEFLPMNRRFPHIWRFDPDGLCEPISVRLVLGESWAENSFHPLTAAIQDSQLEAH